MKAGILHIAIFMSPIFCYHLHAQISPGPLTRAHADLEGISNCTQCHTLGKKVSNEKCLDCHGEIKSRVDLGEGYHASREVSGKDCFDCHSEHHGRNFDMVRFDESAFNHNLTGYELTGAHARVDCRQCHIPDFIEDRELRNRDNTFLGLSRECVGCHEDFHQQTLSRDCASCHTTESFTPAANFDHSRTDFRLAGRHRDVECIECHQEETRNGREFQVFAGVEFENCNSCHDDVHRGNLGTNCKQCHSEQSFASLSLIRRFNHNQTGFRLKGAHNRTDCAGCHNMDAAVTALFQDRPGLEENNCIACHEDVHDNQFGADCAECHNENSFRDINLDRFNHNLTDFALLGKHAAVDCRECHTESLVEPIPHNECAACHSDYHEGEFVTAGLRRDCAECHTVDGFELTLYTLEDHQKAGFPLEGAHLATPCFACHLNEEEGKWRFKNIGTRCVDCHEDVHEGYISEEFYPDKACDNCHVTSNWKENHFDHDLTEFSLSGAHADQECMSCHKMEDHSDQNKYAGFINLEDACYSCHADEHNGQFEQGGITDCARCHGFESWGIEDFDHDQTDFKLEGRHTEIACEACHKPTESDGQVVIQYQFESFACVDCHQ